MSTVLMYLGAIVAANLLTSTFGPTMSVINALLFIGLDLTSRDKLHDAWRGQHLWWKMALLIGVGSVLSWVLSRNAGQIAVASFIAFAVAGGVDAIVYTALGNKTKLVQINGSNIAGAGVDSLLFPWIAFGNVMLWITLLQFGAKVLGGYGWSLVTTKSGKRQRSTTHFAS